MPYYSIIITTHNRSILLERCINSILNNGFDDLELIVVSDEFSIDTFTTVSNNIRDQDKFIKRSGKPGPAASRNIGILHSIGRNVIFIDDDDTFLPCYLSNLKIHADANPGKIIYSNFSVAEENRSIVSVPIENLTHYSVANSALENFYIKNFIHNHTTCFPRESIIGRSQDESLSSLDDWDFLLNVAQSNELHFADIHGPVVHKDNILKENRGSTVDANNSKVLSDYLSIYKKWPAPTYELKIQRQNFIKSNTGMVVDLSWL